ncbi:MAG: uracil-DNA glycosylase [Pseudomonadota bacterium]
MADAFTDFESARAVLAWYRDMGVEEAVGLEPADWSAPAPAASPAAKPKAPTFAPPPKRDGLAEAAADAERIAAACETVEALAEAVAAFEGCPLKPGARSTVFMDGVAGSDLLVIGEAPGREEDARGLPFIGRAGKLLDAMLAAIGRSRSENCLISNVIYWRPPGNRTPTSEEVAICKPFALRLVELSRPKAIALMGGAAAQALGGVTSGVMRARGTWRQVETKSGSVPALPMLHPAYLLRQPAMKRTAWRDLLSLEARLNKP